MARKLLYQQVFSQATLAAFGGSSIQSMNVDGTSTAVTNPELAVVAFPSKAVLLNCDMFSGLQVAISSQALTTLAGSVYLFGIYANGLTPTGSTESAYSATNIVLAAGGNNIFANYGTNADATLQVATATTTSLIACPTWVFPAFLFTAPPTGGGTLTITFWGIQQGVNYS